MWKLSLDYSIKYFIINYFFIIVLTLSLSRKELIERHFFSILIIGVFMPMSIISNHTSSSILGCFFTFLSILFSIYLFRGLNFIFSKNLTLNFTNRRLFTVNRLLNGTLYFSGLLISFLVFSNWHSLTTFNILSTLENVYDIREDNTLTGIVSYFPGWIMGICVPILLASFIIKKNYFILLLTFVGVFLMFQIFAMKVQIFSVIMLCLFSLMYKYSNSLKYYTVEIFYLLVFFISYIFSDIMYVFLDRFFYLTGQLNLHYYEFYSKHAKNYFQGSKLGWFFPASEYRKPMGYVIDDYFYGGGMNANTGYIASSFGELGFFGYIFSTLIISIVVYSIFILYQKSKEVAYLIAIQVAFSLINSPLSDIFLTNGVILIIIISFALKPNLKSREKHARK